MATQKSCAGAPSRWFCAGWIQNQGEWWILYGYRWLLNGYIWLYVVIYGYMWLFHGYRWLLGGYRWLLDCYLMVILYGYSMVIMWRKTIPQASHDWEWQSYHLWKWWQFRGDGFWRFTSWGFTQWVTVIFSFWSSNVTVETLLQMKLSMWKMICYNHGCCPLACFTPGGWPQSTR